MNFEYMSNFYMTILGKGFASAQKHAVYGMSIKGKSVMKSWKIEKS